VAASGTKRAASQQSSDVSLTDAAQELLDECRMVLPGIQALFGFQLIAVFSNGFDALQPDGKVVHLIATGLVAVAVAMIMTPAALHRQTTPRRVTTEFIEVSSRLLLMSMFTLAIGICLDFFLIARLIVDGTIALLAAVALFVLFMALWYVWPRIRRARLRASGAR
jgi:DNA-binding transcriptional LysR family regulator